MFATMKTTITIHSILNYVLSSIGSLREQKRVAEKGTATGVFVSCVRFSYTHGG
jgi:hypothetical protein